MIYIRDSLYLLGGGCIKPVENFDLLITLQGHKDESVGEELIGIEEVELALQSYEPILYIKESQFPNVILVDLSMDPDDAVLILKEAPTTVISKVVPIDAVVRTRMDTIIEKVITLTSKKIKLNESFVVRCDLRGRKYIESKDGIINAVSNELIEKLNLNLDEKNPDWIVQIEVVGDDAGISVSKPERILKKL